MQLVRVVAVVAGVAFGSRVAHAGKVKPIKAQFLCGTFVDGKIKEPILAGKHGKLTDPIACAIHVDDAKEPSHMGTVHTVRHVGAKKVETDGKTDDFGSQSDDAKRDFNIVLQPGIDFQPCEDFDIAARIADDLGTYFTKTIAVKQVCPKPKPIAAKLSCMYEAQDGTALKWPGNGDRLKARLSSGKDLECMIYAKVVPDGTTLTGVAQIKGKPGSVKKVPADIVPPDGGSKVDVSWSPGEETFDECEVFALQASLVDQDGATRWTGTQKIVQDCPD